MKHAIISYFLGIILFLVGCGSDDDVNTPTDQTGFFPKTITETTTNASSTITFSYEYDDDNRIISITNDSSTDVTLEYNENGMIDKIINNTDIETFEINYNGNIITSRREFQRDNAGDGEGIISDRGGGSDCRELSRGRCSLHGELTM